MKNFKLTKEETRVLTQFCLEPAKKVYDGWDEIEDKIFESLLKKKEELIEIGEFEEMYKFIYYHSGVTNIIFKSDHVLTEEELCDLYDLISNTTREEIRLYNKKSNRIKMGSRELETEAKK